MSITQELKSRNFGVYAQWFALASILLCFAMGIAKIFSFSLFVIFGALALAIGILTIVAEINFIHSRVRGLERLEHHGIRAAFYTICAIVMWLSLILGPSILIAPAITLSGSAICYAVGHFLKQDFIGLSFLGGRQKDIAVAIATRGI